MSPASSCSGSSKVVCGPNGASVKSHEKLYMVIYLSVAISHFNPKCLQWVWLIHYNQDKAVHLWLVRSTHQDPVLHARLTTGLLPWRLLTLKKLPCIWMSLKLLHRLASGHLNVSAAKRSLMQWILIKTTVKCLVTSTSHISVVNSRNLWPRNHISL